MHAMDAIQVFNDELQSLLGSKPSVSKAKMVQITRAAMKGVKFYKHIVQAVEKFIARCRPEYMIPGLYVIDSIVRQSRHQFGSDRDVYTARFSRNIMMTFETLFANCLPDDKPKIVRVLNLWQKNGVFEPLIVQPLMDMASTASSSARAPPSSPPDIGGGGRPSNRYLRHTERGGGADDGLKFNKDMLDFDYDEDDDDAGDETPTEAEPPLSSTLNKMGIEHRGSHRGGGGGGGGDGKSKLYQSSQGTTDNSHQKHSNQDAVLERWQRIVNGQSTSSDSLVGTDKYNRDSGRSRSRSPPGTHQQQPPQAKFPINKPEQGQDKTWLDQNLAAKDAERAAERERRCLPKIRDKHITVCSATLWLGHVPKNVTEVDVSDTFGEYGTIHSIDLVPPRGCAYVCMDRRQDAKRALNESKDIRLKGSQIKMAWAPGKGFKEYKKLKDFWEADVGASFIPYSRVDSSMDFEVLEEGGVIDEDSLSIEMRERRERQAKDKKTSKGGQAESQLSSGLSQPLPHMPVLNQPVPPTSIQPFNIPPPNMSIPPPTMAIGQGLIHFPPPGVTTTSSGHNHMLLPPPSMAGSEKDKPEDPSTSIDHQLSMTERQISMVEQQLNMIQQAQGIGRGIQAAMQIMPPNPQQHPPPQIFHQHHHNQPDPMIFNMPPMHQPPPPMMQNMLDPTLAMFASNPLQHLMCPPPHMMMPTSMLHDNSDQPPPNMNDQSVIQID